ncbi:MAG: FtsX-like permease family protein [Pseudomonadota bacterium]
MLRHMMKLIWKRKTRNLMLTLEILLAFVLLFALAAFALRSAQLYRLPLGFVYQDVWSVAISSDSEEPGHTGFEAFKRDLLAMPEIEGVALAGFGPFSDSTMTNRFEGEGGVQHAANMLVVSDDYASVSGIALVAGRWFGPADGGTDVTPVVINRHFAEELFPGKSALGQLFTDSDYGDKHPNMLKVTGVIDDYRGRSDFMAPGNYMITREKPEPGAGIYGTLVLKLRAGTPRYFEARLQERLRQVDNTMHYDIAPQAELRSAILRQELTPLAGMAVVAAFMLLMVGFGLFGVLWQNTTRRIPELGLRRAVGATAGQIYLQIIGEQALLSTVAIAAAMLLLVQLPLAGAFANALNAQVFIGAAVLSAGLIYLVSLLCALYPGWHASRLSPSAALHDE